MTFRYVVISAELVHIKEDTAPGAILSDIIVQTCLCNSEEQAKARAYKYNLAEGMVAEYFELTPDDDLTFEAVAFWRKGSVEGIKVAKVSRGEWLALHRIEWLTRQGARGDITTANILDFDYTAYIPTRPADGLHVVTPQRLCEIAGLDYFNRDDSVYFYY